MENVCLYCGDPVQSNSKVHPKCYQKYYHQQRRRKIIEHYGGECSECGQHIYDALLISYKIPDKSNLTGSALYTYIINNDYPDEFEVLCEYCIYRKIEKNNIPRKQETIRKRQALKIARKRATLAKQDESDAYDLSFTKRRKRVKV